MNGAQINLRVYGIPSNDNAPMVTRSTCASVNQACSVELVSASGKPEENPRSSNAKRRGSDKVFASEDIGYQLWQYYADSTIKRKGEGIGDLNKSSRRKRHSAEKRTCLGY